MLRPFIAFSVGFVLAAFGVFGNACGDDLPDRSTTTSPSTDWPMWRCDAGRTAVTPMPLPDDLHLQWTRQLPSPRPAFRSARLQFDLGYEPIVIGDQLLVGSTVNNSLTSYDTDTGAVRWRFFAEGPVRCAPAGLQDKVFFGSDDGHLYCLDVATGSLRWKIRAVPSSRRVLGNGRLISVWPVRGGPVVADGRVYFAAGVWPFEGAFVYAVDAETGDVLWRNDRLGYLYGQQPHAAEALGGLTPQGYLIVNGDHLVVPCGTAFPAILDQKAGDLISFELPSAGRLPGGWFAAVDSETARDVRRGEIVFDRDISTQRHEDKVHSTPAPSKVRASITVGGNKLFFDKDLPQVPGTVYSALAARDRLFVVARSGAVHCFGSKVVDSPRVYEPVRTPLKPATERVAEAKRLIDLAGTRRGYALVWGLDDGQLVEALVRESDYHVIGIDRDAKHVAELRQRFDDAGRYGPRVTLVVADQANADLPPYAANLVTSEVPASLMQQGETAVARAFRSLRPYGGALCLRSDGESHAALADIARRLSLDGGELSHTNGYSVIRRAGALPGATNYAGDWQPSEDARVRAPLGVLWFDDVVPHFKRSPQPKVIDGVMVSYLKNWTYPGRTGAADYPLAGPAMSDVYTGRLLKRDEATSLRKKFPIAGPDKREPAQYRPPKQKDPWKPEPPRPGRRVNPLTGDEEPRTFPKSYGCDGGFDYGSLFTMRSATAAFYDKTNDSGTIHISGPRSGCTNSIIPACGVLNLPYFYEGCTCSYPLPSGAALISMPENFEQWASWGPGAPKNIQRIGINFGAPGDRKTRDGTLWLDYPSVGGPSPEIETQTLPDAPRYYYRHSMWIESAGEWPWVVASGAEGLASFAMNNMKPGRYTVRLFFAELAGKSAGDRLQDISIQGSVVLRDFDIAQSAGGPLRSVVRGFHDVAIDGQFTLELSATRGDTIISGVELIRVKQKE